MGRGTKGSKRLAWRIVAARHAGRAFDGEGARLFGGRWNSVGTPVVYLAETRALALLELLVHLGDELALRRYVRFRVELPARACAELERSRLPAAWRHSPAPAELQRIGDEWASSRRSLALAVPSAVVPEEHLVLLNPRHGEWDSIEVGPAEPLAVDSRLK